MKVNGLFFLLFLPKSVSSLLIRHLNTISAAL